MNATIKNLRQLVALSETVKSWTTGMAMVGRLLIDEKEAHLMQELATELGSNTATIEQNLARLSRVALFVKKFVAK